MQSRASRPALLSVFLLMPVFGAWAAADDPSAVPPVGAAKKAALNEKTLTWHTRLADGLAEAQRLRRPVLVRLGSASCPWCRKLEDELRLPNIKSELSRWSLVSLDVDDAARDARAMAVSGVPALRVLTPAGRAVAARDGFVAAEPFGAWLKEHHDAAVAPPPADLIAEDSPDAIAVLRLVGELRARDPVLREATVRRLLPFPEFAAAPVAEAFVKGPLQARLAALELLQEWQAPVLQLDPWRPETLTAARMTALKAWAATPSEFAGKVAGPLTAATLASARDEIARMVKADDAEALVVRERLARHGSALLPEVYAQLKAAATDMARERLTALRYRLVASAALALSWPAGLERLAATAAGPRQQAIQELAARAGPGDEPLLLELFSNSDPLVRELSLRALKETAGDRATEALTRLLSDPEPNVRAAVLKQLAEQPTPAMVARVVEYVRGEKDSDLVVHAIRAIREVQAKSVLGCLKELLGHESWQVRAEATEALGKRVARYGGNNSEEQAAVYVALIKMLDDPDGFVVSRAVPVLRYSNLAVVIEPLAAAADRHPELAADVATALGSYVSLGAKVLPHLQKLAAHARPETRAAAIAGLCSLTLRREQDRFFDYGHVGNMGAAAPVDYIPTKELKTALADSSSVVRQAAAMAVFQYVNSLGPQHNPYDGKEYAQGAKEADQAAWLEAFRGGKGRPAWLADLLPLLDPHLKATELEERLHAALVLTAMAREDRALPVLLDVARTEPELRIKAAAALPWLLWPKRLELFDRLLDNSRQPEELAALASQMARLPDKRAVPRLWEVLASGKVPADAAQSWLGALEQLYLGPGMNRTVNGKRDIPPERRKETAAAAGPRTEKGPDVQRLVALALLASAAPDSAAAAAGKIVADAGAGATLRRDAFQILLVVSGSAGMTPVALEGLSSTDPAIRQLSAAALARGLDDYSWRQVGTLYLNADAQDYRGNVRYGGGTLIVPEAPRGLKAEAIRPLLRDPDPMVVAHAGYLLAVLGDPAGLAPLASYWQAHQRKDPAWARLVYRAVAALGDDANVPLLEEIYRGFQQERHHVREFYWTIRILDGPNVLRLRKQIRKDVGIDSLR